MKYDTHKEHEVSQTQFEQLNVRLVVILLKQL